MKRYGGMGYATKDINNDGIDELVFMTKDYRIFALFTMENSQPKLLLYSDKTSFLIDNEGTVHGSRYSPNEYSICYTKTIVDGELVGLEYGAVADGDSVKYYKIENGKSFDSDREEFYRLMEIDQYRFGVSNSDVNRKTGFRFVPAILSPEDMLLPKPDFSSYDAILNLYKDMVEKAPSYKGAESYFFDDNETYDIFKNLYDGVRYCESPNCFGYAKHDLNGDGVDELLLLTETYDLLSLYTMRDGVVVPLLLPSTAQIYENGLIHASVWTGGAVDRDGEVYVYKIENAELKPIVSVGYNVNVYLKKEGWYRIENGKHVEISAEEGEAEYDLYDIVPVNYSDTEYSREVSGVEFVPLFKRATASKEYEHTYSNSQFINGDTLTFANVTEDSLDFELYVIWQAWEREDPREEIPTIKTTITGSAVKDGDVYRFDTDGIKGYIELLTDGAWLFVSESEKEGVICKPYLFDCKEN